MLNPITKWRRRETRRQLPRWFAELLDHHIPSEHHPAILDGKPLDPGAILELISPQPPVARFDNPNGNLFLFIDPDTAEARIVFIDPVKGLKYSHIKAVQDLGRVTDAWNDADTAETIDQYLKEGKPHLYPFAPAPEERHRYWVSGGSPLQYGWLILAVMLTGTPRPDLQHAGTLIALGAYPAVDRLLDEFPRAVELISPRCTYYLDNWTPVERSNLMTPAL